MAHFSESLCEEVIKTEGRCGLTMNEKVQMARFALRAIKNENLLLVDAIRYRWARQHGAWDTESFLNSLTPEQYDAELDKRMAGDSSPSAAHGGDSK